MASNAVQHCQALYCSSQATDVGPLHEMHLCRTHLERENRHIDAMGQELLNDLNSIHIAADVVQALETEQSWLQAEIRQTEAMFDALRDKVEQWREATLSRVTSAHSRITERLVDVDRAEERKNEISQARDSGDRRRVVRLAGLVRPWLDDAMDSFKKFSETRQRHLSRQNREGRGVHRRSIGAVSAGVEQMQLSIDRHMEEMLRQSWLDEEGPAASSRLVCRSKCSINDLPNMPYYIASCTNTDGYVISSTNGIVLRADVGPAEDRKPLPQACLFIAFDPAANEPNKDLLAVSLDGNVRLTVQWRPVENNKTTGLLCDSERQLIFAAQIESVTVMDLSGRLSRLIDSNSINLPSEFTGIAGTDQHLLALDRQHGRVLTFHKDSLDLLSNIDIGGLIHVDGKLRGVATHRNSILIADFEKGLVHRVCSISGRATTSWPTHRSTFKRFLNPWQVVADQRGIIIVSEFHGHTVRLMTNDGALMQTLGKPRENGDSEDTFSHPAGIALVETDNLRLLAVADVGNKRIRVFEML